MRAAFGLVLAAVMLAWPALAPATGGPVAHASSSSPTRAPASSAARPQGADFRGEAASNDARRVADWAVTVGDNHGLPFIIVDKVQAKVFVFGPDGRLRGASTALLGRARGDDTVPGIGQRKLSEIRPEERTTPAGRFVATLGRDLHKDILWIDYDAAVSLHRVVAGDPGDHRLQRLVSASPLDKRISYGCINVPVRFYEDIVLKAFTGTRGIVYILPEVKTLNQVFAISGAAAANRQ